MINKALIYNNCNKAFQFIGIVSFFFLWAVLFTFLPWLIFLILLLTFFLGSLMLMKMRWGLYFFILFVPILANYVGFYLPFRGVTVNKVIPLFSIVAAIGFLCLGMYRASKMSEPVLPKNPLTIPVILFSSYAFSTIIGSPIFEYNLVAFSLLITNIILFFFTAQLIDNEEFHRRLMWCWIVSGMIVVILTIISIPVHPEMVIKKYLIDKVYLMFYWRPKTKYRGYALGHPNYTSLTLNLMICITTGIFLTAKGRFKKVFLFMALCIMIFADFLTKSKGGIGSFLIMALFIIVFSSALRKNLVRNITLFIVIFLLLFTLSVIYGEKAGTPRLLNIDKQGETQSLKERIEMWKEGFKWMKKQSAYLSGLGIGNYDFYTKLPHPHNLYLSFYFDFGFIGIGFMLAAVLFLIKLIWDMNKVMWIQQTYLQVMTLVLCGGFIAIGIHGLVDHPYNRNILWIFLAFAISTFQLTRIEFATYKESI